MYAENLDFPFFLNSSGPKNHLCHPVTDMAAKKGSVLLVSDLRVSLSFVMFSSCFPVACLWCCLPRTALPTSPPLRRSLHRRSYRRRRHFHRRLHRRQPCFCIRYMLSSILFSDSWVFVTWFPFKKSDAEWR